MGKLTTNISRHELACKCGCGGDTMDFETLLVVQNCCNHFAKELDIRKVSLTITSAYRCLEHNRCIGSTDASQHPLGRAMDIKIVQVDPEDVYEYLVGEFPGKYGIGRYESFIHIDTRTNGPARW